MTMITDHCTVFVNFPHDQDDLLLLLCCGRLVDGVLPLLRLHSDPRLIIIVMIMIMIINMITMIMMVMMMIW